MGKEKPTKSTATKTVVVLRGKNIRHDGETYAQNTRVELPEEAADRLISLGFVKTMDALLQEAEEADADAQAVSVTKEDGQVSVTTDPSASVA